MWFRPPAVAIAMAVASALLALSCDDSPTGGDLTGPAAVTDLRVSGATPWTVTLAYTAPGDDGASGTATAYDILFSNEPITAQNWTRAPRVASPPPPSPAGSAETFRFGSLEAGRAYWFAIRARDEERNWGPLSTVVADSTPAFGYLGEFSPFHFTTPRAVAWAAAGDVLVSDLGCVRRLSPTGRLIATWSNAGPGSGGSSEARGIVVHGNLAYLADTWNHRICVFSVSGEFGLCFSEYGTTPGRLWAPRGVATDRAGNIYVVDHNHRVSKFHPMGFLIGMWGQWGNMPGSFDEPVAIVIDPEGDIFTLETGTPRVQRFGAEGNFETSWGRYDIRDGEFLSPAAIAIDAGDVLVLDNGRADVQRFTRDGVFLSRWGGAGPASGQFEAPSGMCTDGQGTYYVVQPHPSRVQRFGALPPLR